MSVKTSKPTIDITHPEVAAQWHPTKNGDLKSDMFTYGSGKKFWWLCKNNHPFEMTIAARTGRGRGCPYCSGQRVGYGNDLKSVNPALAKEWHPTMNESMTPSDVMPYTHKKYWWLCMRGHLWESSVANRSKGHGCPHCSHQTSFPQMYLYIELATIFDKVKYEDRIEGRQVDILIDDLNLVLEYDGSYWHKKKFKKDLDKRCFFKDLGYNVLNIREKPLKKLSKSDISVSPNTDFYNLTRQLLVVLKSQFYISKSQKRKIDEYLLLDEPQNEKTFLKFKASLPNPLPGKSFSEVLPELAKEWHSTKNGNLKPHNIPPHSAYKPWWECDDKHSWKETLSNRINKKTGCPFCSGKRATPERNLVTEYPLVAKEWHPAMNNDLKPTDFAPFSHYKAWWLCINGHKWQARIDSRTIGRYGCRFCYYDSKKTTG